MAVAEHTHSIGQEITMTLMKRAKYSVFAMPKIKWSERTSLSQLSSGTKYKSFHIFNCYIYIILEILIFLISTGTPVDKSFKL